MARYLQRFYWMRIEQTHPLRRLFLVFEDDILRCFEETEDDFQCWKPSTVLVENTEYHLAFNDINSNLNFSG